MAKALGFDFGTTNTVLAVSRWRHHAFAEL